MKNLKLTVTLLFVLMAISCSKDDDEVIPFSKIIQTVINEVKSDFKTGGAVIAIRKSDGTIETGVFGKSDGSTLLSKKMSLGIGSNTKTFTAALIFKLIEANELNLTDKLSDLLPERVSANISGNITIKQLLNHTSGLYDPIDDDL